MINDLTSRYIKTLDSLIERALVLNKSIKEQEKELKKSQMMTSVIFGALSSVLMFVITIFSLYNQDYIISKSTISKIMPMFFLMLSFAFIFISFLQYKNFNSNLLKKNLALDINELHDLLAYIDEYKGIIHSILIDNMDNEEKRVNNEEIIAALEQADFRLRYISFSHK